MVFLSLKNKIKKIPQSPGAYVFYGAKKDILYVGKATNLRSRVQSYFRGGESGRLIGIFIGQVADIATQETDSVLEALILESNLIKRLQPKYNAMGKDDKSFCYFVITEEEWPRVLIIRETDLEKNKNIYAKKFGPYTSKKQMEIALKIMRRIFPFHSSSQKTEKGCLDFQLGFCPGPYAGAITKDDYRKNIRGIKMILEGKKKNLVKKLEKEMKEHSDRHEYEKAGELRNKIYALKHINDIALISRDDNSQSPISNFQINSKNQKPKTKNFRIEAYDISNISGQHAVGSMVVFKNDEPDKAEYRKFRIKTVEGIDDVGAMREVLLRRFRHTLTPSPSPSKREGGFWSQPDLILLDGGIGHANMAGKILSELKLKIPTVSVAKGKARKNLNFQFPISNKFPMTKFSNEIRNVLSNKNLIKRIMDEAHRFAIGYHRKLRKKNLLA